jgi:hypothetical protein
VYSPRKTAWYSQIYVCPLLLVSAAHILENAAVFFGGLSCVERALFKCISTCIYLAKSPILTVVNFTPLGLRLDTSALADHLDLHPQVFSALNSLLGSSRVCSHGYSHPRVGYSRVYSTTHHHHIHNHHNLQHNHHLHFHHHQMNEAEERENGNGSVRKGTLTFLF